MTKKTVIWAAGDVNLEPLAKDLEAYVKAGGTLVVNVEAAKALKLVGVRWPNARTRVEGWSPDRKTSHPTTPYEVEEVVTAGAEPIAWAAETKPLVLRNKVGGGAVITVLVPRGLGLDERAHPVLPALVGHHAVRRPPRRGGLSGYASAPVATSAPTRSRLPLRSTTPSSRIR